MIGRIRDLTKGLPLGGAMGQLSVLTVVVIVNYLPDLIHKNAGLMK